jgi:hypothetical protein
MPCFLAWVLKDMGQPLEGNFINLSINDFANKLNQQQLTSV